MLSEIKIHKSIKHPNIVHFEHVFEDKENVYILLELCKNETLSELLKRRRRLTEFEICVYMRHVIKALEYLHANKIIHRDLKLSNLFLSSTMETKVGDFGLAAKLLEEDDKRFTVCGTPNYIAPEVLEQKGHSFGVDTWALGVLIYTMIVGIPPFETPNLKSTYKLIKEVKYSFPEDVSISPSAKELINHLLLYSPDSRLNLTKLLSHPFMSYAAPDLLPLSTLSCPPSATYLRQYIKKECVDFLIVEEVKRQFDKLDDQMSRSLDRDDLNQNFLEARSKDESKNDTTKSSSIDNYRIVDKFADYSAKYGIGYLLENKDIGVLFNDQTTLFYPYNNE